MSKERLPRGWKWVSLDETGEFLSGGTPSKKIEEFWNGAIPFVTGADITEPHIGAAHARATLTEKGLRSGKTAVCEPNSLLFVTRTRVGRIGLAVTTMGASQDITVVEPKRHVHPEYLCRYLLSISDVLVANCRGSTIQGLTRDFVKGLPIPLPPSLAEQERIVGVLNAQMAALERARKAIEERLEAARALRGSFAREVLSNAAYEWPKEYAKVRLGDICTVVTGGTPPRSKSHCYGGTVPWLTPSHLGLSKYTGKGDECLTEEGLKFVKLVPRGAVLVTCISGSRNNIGKASIAERPIATNQQINSVVPGPKIESEFLYYYLLTSKPKLHALAANTNQNIVNKSKLSSLEVFLPPLDSQRRTVEEINKASYSAASVERLIDHNTEGITSLAPALLRRAFSGEV